MKIKLTKEQRIGLFTILVLAALYFTINYLRGKDLFGSTNIYYAVYESVDGISVSGPVYIKGLKVGTIEKIKYQKKTDNMLITMKLKSEYNIPDSSVAEIFSTDLLGSKAIRIVTAGSGKYLEEKDTIRTSVDSDLFQMLGQELLPLKEQISELVESIKGTFDNINNVLDDEGKARISSALANLDRSLADLQRITSNIRDKEGTINRVMGNIDTLTGSLSKSSEHLDISLKNFQDITDSLNRADLAGTVSALRSILMDLNNPQGSIGKLIKSDSLHNSVDSVLNQLEDLIRNINENPKKYIKVSVF
ncbi:MAG: MlaD family protein [Bacteroidales bacterium]|nr:MlaD family protein [Bacteroidales bacterium]MDD2424751.1 MlaD family protein [Bacteroidales bacterium]MDD3988681.1 MlaD family protein [Bacteroidales bacterium]MDD4639292.1 MlaD family protein [Bacteroidales bacterium]